MVVKHCCYALCTSDNRYPNKLPPGTCFLPFAKPGTIKDNMTEWEKRQQKSKTERAKRWIHACGRKHFTLVKQITKYSYICSLHFIDPIEENPDPIIATSTTERKCRKRKPAGRTSESCAKSCNNEDELITDDIVCAIDNLKKDYTNVEVNFVIDTEPKNNKATQTVSV